MTLKFNFSELSLRCFCTWLQSICGELSWLDIMWKDTHLSQCLRSDSWQVRSQLKPWRRWSCLLNSVTGMCRGSKTFLLHFPELGEFYSDMKKCGTGPNTWWSGWLSARDPVWRWRNFQKDNLHSCSGFHYSVQTKSFLSDSLLKSSLRTVTLWETRLYGLMKHDGDGIRLCECVCVGGRGLMVYIQPVRAREDQIPKSRCTKLISSAPYTLKVVITDNTVLHQE